MNRTAFSAIAVTAALLIGAVAAPVLAQRGPPPPPPVGASNPFQGKADAIATGQQLYEANCLGCHGANGGPCHMIRGKGGLCGPELSNIAGFRKTQSIVNALTKPYHRVYPPGGAHLLELPPRGDWHPVAVTTQDGRIIKGVLLNQDPHGLQMMGDDQQLHLFVREKLRSVTVDPASRMPTDYDKRLTPEELKDLLACPTRLGRHTTQTVSAAPAVDR